MLFSKVVLRVMQANCLTVFSSRGNGTDGHKRILVPLVDYNNQLAPAGPWVDPDPPAQLVQWQAGHNTAEVARGNANYEVQFREYTTFRGCINACNADLFGCMPEEYLGALRDPITGYSHLDTETIIAHLLDNYGEMQPEDIRRVYEVLHAPFDPTTQSMQSLFIRGRDCQADVAHKNPMTEMTKIDAIFHALELSGHYASDLTKWRAQPAAQQTWAVSHEW